MELRIYNPQEDGFLKEIQWNHEELKAEIAAKMNDYNNLAFTENDIKDMKSDRANLRKLKDAFESERKRIKKLCLEPYDKFEAQVKEITNLIDQPIGLIDSQIKEIEEKRKSEKLKEIKVLFDEAGFQEFVKFEMIFDEKWLNASVSLKKIDEQLHQILYKVGDDVYTIHQLSEFNFEAMETYKKTLNLSEAIKEGQRLSDLQKRKLAMEEEEKRRQAELEAQKVTEEQKAAEMVGTSEPSDEVFSDPVVVAPKEDEPTYTVDFRVIATKEQLVTLKAFLKQKNITFCPVPTTVKGE